MARNRSLWVNVRNPVCGASCVEFFLCGAVEAVRNLWQDGMRVGGCNLRRALGFFWSVADAFWVNSESVVAPSLQLAKGLFNDKKQLLCKRMNRNRIGGRQQYLRPSAIESLDNDLRRKGPMLAGSSLLFSPSIVSPAWLLYRDSGCEVGERRDVVAGNECLLSPGRRRSGTTCEPLPSESTPSGSNKMRGRGLCPQCRSCVQAGFGNMDQSSSDFLKTTRRPCPGPVLLLCKSEVVAMPPESLCNMESEENTRNSEKQIQTQDKTKTTYT